MAVDEAPAGFGLPVTRVAAFGWPVVYVTPPLATAAAGPARNAPARRARPSVMDPDEMEDEIEQAIDDGDVEMGR
jgi:hypothetical protein